MKKTFTLIKPGGNLELHYCQGSVRTETNRTVYTIESPDHIFTFGLKDPTGTIPMFAAKNIKALHPAYVIFENGLKVEYPVYQCGKTERLPADERTARWLAIQTNLSETAHNQLIEQVESLNDEIALMKPGRGKHKKNDKTPAEKRWELSVYNHYTSIFPRLPFEKFAGDFYSDYELTAKELELLVDRVRTRIKRGTK